MALTLEQEKELLKLLKEKKVTLSELPAATAVNNDDLLLTRQGITDRSITSSLLQSHYNNEVLKKSANLTDVKDKGKARDALGLGKLALKDGLSAADVGAMSTADGQKIQQEFQQHLDEQNEALAALAAAQIDTMHRQVVRIFNSYRNTACH